MYDRPYTGKVAEEVEAIASMLNFITILSKFYAKVNRLVLEAGCGLQNRYFL